MRPIEFRAWDKKHKEMLIPDGNGYFGSDYHQCFVIDGNGQPIYMDNCETPEDIELTQFTGLLDKNGVKIFEGDIVKIHNLKEDWECHGEPDFDWRIFKIEWNRCTYAYNNKVLYKPLSDYDLRTAEDYDIEVIGNIYQNSNLIKE